MFSLTVLVAAQLWSASRLFAQDVVVVVDAAVVVGARVARAELAAALMLVALAVVALHPVRVRDGSVTTTAGIGVTVYLLCKVNRVKGRGCIVPPKPTNSSDRSLSTSSRS